MTGKHADLNISTMNDSISNFFYTSMQEMTYNNLSCKSLEFGKALK